MNENGSRRIQKNIKKKLNKDGEPKKKIKCKFVTVIDSELANDRNLFRQGIRK